MKPQRVGGEWEPLVGGEEQIKALKEIKAALTNAPGLGLLDVMKSFSCNSMNKMGQILDPDSGTGLLALSGGLLVKTT
jgi:hypothetical protein